MVGRKRPPPSSPPQKVLRRQEPPPPPKALRRQERPPPRLAPARGQYPAGHPVRAAARASVTVLRRAWVAIFDPPAPPVAAETVETEGLRAYLQRSFEKQRRAGGRVLAVALLLGGGWATLVPLSGAVVVPGTVVAASAVKKVQHQTGGTVTAIAVTDGMRVAAGDVLVRLDDTQVRANYQAVSKQLEEVRARIARLSAERDGREDDALPAKAAADRAPSELLASETTLFRARSDSRRSQRQLLRNRVAQLNDEITGLDAQSKSKDTQSGLITQELDGVQKLWEQRLTPLTRVTSLQREAARLEGEKAQLVSAIAETRGKIAETEMQLVKIDQDFRTDVMKDLRDAQDKEGELVEKTVSAKDQLTHIDLRAPVTGVVHELAVHTVGGVVTPAQVVMVIVPEGDELAIDAHLPPEQIDQVHKGQVAEVKFPAFNQRTTLDLAGEVAHVSADITHDQPTSPGYYTVRVTLSGEQLAKLGDRQLVAGMPAELFIQTTTRTMISYMFKPLTEQLGRMFRER